MNCMTPIRWLISIIILTGMYVVFVLTALRFGWLIPQQIHSAALTTLTGGVIVAAIAIGVRKIVATLDSSSARRDEVILAKLDEVLFRHTCWMEATAQTVVLKAGMTGELPRAAAVGTYVAQAQIAEVRELGSRLDRALRVVED